MKEDYNLRESSGNVSSDSMLVSFLYELMRDHVPPGQIEKVLENSLFISKDSKSTTVYTNGYLANYAIHVANQLTNK